MKSVLEIVFSSHRWLKIGLKRLKIGQNDWWIRILKKTLGKITSSVLLALVTSRPPCSTMWLFDCESFEKYQTAEQSAWLSRWLITCNRVSYSSKKETSCCKGWSGWFHFGITLWTKWECRNMLVLRRSRDAGVSALLWNNFNILLWDRVMTTYYGDFCDKCYWQIILRIEKSIQNCLEDPWTPTPPHS